MTWSLLLTTLGALGVGRAIARLLLRKTGGRRFAGEFVAGLCALLGGLAGHAEPGSTLRDAVGYTVPLAVITAVVLLRPVKPAPQGERDLHSR